MQFQDTAQVLVLPRKEKVSQIITTNPYRSNREFPLRTAGHALT